jgi:hypothetical protein
MGLNMTKKQAIWKFRMDEQINTDLQYAENRYTQIFGRKPSKSDLLNLLVRSFKEVEFKRKPKSKKEPLFC